MSVFLGELSKVAAESLNVVVLDNAPAHIARGLVAFGGIFHVVPQTSAHRARAGGRREHRVVGIAAVLAGVESGGATLAGDSQEAEGVRRNDTNKPSSARRACWRDSPGIHAERDCQSDRIQLHPART